MKCIIPMDMPPLHCCKGYAKKDPELTYYNWFLFFFITLMGRCKIDPGLHCLQTTWPFFCIFHSNCASRVEHGIHFCLGIFIKMLLKTPVEGAMTMHNCHLLLSSLNYSLLLCKHVLKEEKVIDMILTDQPNSKHHISRLYLMAKFTASLHG
jgi:hypothetical protein